MDDLNYQMVKLWTRDHHTGPLKQDTTNRLRGEGADSEELIYGYFANVFVAFRQLL